jgi:hypothetical protein
MAVNIGTCHHRARDDIARCPKFDLYLEVVLAASRTIVFQGQRTGGCAHLIWPHLGQ